MNPDKEDRTDTHLSEYMHPIHVCVMYAGCAVPAVAEAAGTLDLYACVALPVFTAHSALFPPHALPLCSGQGNYAHKHKTSDMDTVQERRRDCNATPHPVVR